jgi:hypothetical protein
MYTSQSNPNLFHIPDTTPVPIARLSAVGFFQSISHMVLPLVQSIGKVNTNSVDLAYVLDIAGLFDPNSHRQVLVDPIECGTFNPRFRRGSPELTIKISTVTRFYQEAPNTVIVPLMGQLVVVDVSRGGKGQSFRSGLSVA